MAIERRLSVRGRKRWAPRSWMRVAPVALVLGLAVVPTVRADASGVELWFYSEHTDFGVVAVGQSVTRSIGYQNDGTGATLEVFVQNDREQFSAPATIDVPGFSSGEFEVTFAPRASGQFATGIVLSIGGEAWVTQVGGMALNPAPDDQSDAIPIVAGQGDTFSYATHAGWATTSDVEASCGVSNGMWFSYSADVDTVVTLITGGPASFGEVVGGQVVSCSSGNWLPFTVLAGTTSYFFTGPTGGPDVFDLSARARPLSHITLSVNPKATVTRAGAVTIQGTGANTPDGGTIVSVTATQRSGHGYITAASGPWGVWMTEDGVPLSFTLAPERGRFVAGPISIHIGAGDQDGDVFGWAIVDAQVKAVVGK